ncbi:hypothetical protein EYF80_028071 [Liparis tanakae]|uniref:Uncharacterized protein n=1 Tax=Liparis tanakae TaxID=230148 RepID=A0A4Z2H7D3_9TELE|nr:hypothetical protein EYF80_028071 [Liparis tanakae]
MSSRFKEFRYWRFLFHNIGGLRSPAMAHVNTTLWPTVTVVTLTSWPSGRAREDSAREDSAPRRKGSTFTVRPARRRPSACAFDSFHIGNGGVPTPSTGDSARLHEKEGKEAHRLNFELLYPFTHESQTRQFANNLEFKRRSEAAASHERDDSFDPHCFSKDLPKVAPHSYQREGRGEERRHGYLYAGDQSVSF